ncbi:type II secretion system F family protein [Jiangella muralis]|uniref:type II secretion system F family protein n=1 Tax=Jiangella muralis TaxID=702383 RepID=UPI00196A0424|nr:type II secretion system F family protein [Jiangella muralis]
MTTGLAALFGLGVGTGLTLIVLGRRRIPDRAGSGSLRIPAIDQRTLLRLGLAAGSAVLAVALTGWLVGAILAAAATWWLPRLVGRNRDQEEKVAKIEAIAAWTEMLRDTLAAAAGLEQAIVATAPIAPAPIRTEIEVLASRIEAGHRLAPALRRLAQDLDDPSGDLVVAALAQAAHRQASRLGDLLSTLARAARDQAAMRLRVEANRSRTRTSIRVIVVTTVGFAAGLVLWNRDYLSAFDDALGQLVLLAIGGLFTVGFTWLSRIARIDDPARLFTSSTVAGPVVAEGPNGGRAGR